MTEFFGLLNDNGLESKFRIFIDLNAENEYITDFYMDNIRSDAKICGDQCTISVKKESGLLDINYLCDVFFDIKDTGITYDMTIKQYSDEIIITGKESGNFCLLCIPLFSRPTFFVATNKIEV